MSDLKLKIITASISNRYAAASTLGGLNITSKFSYTELSGGIEKSEFEKVLGNEVLHEFEKLDNKEYRAETAALIQSNSKLIELYQRNKFGDLKSLGNNLIGNIENRFIDLEVQDDIKNGYIIGLSQSLGAALFIATEFNGVQVSELESMDIHPFDYEALPDKLQTNPELLKNVLRYLQESDNEKKYFFHRATAFSELLTQNKNNLLLRETMLAALKANKASLLFVNENSIADA
jgi:hypothetical protein